MQVNEAFEKHRAVFHLLRAGLWQLASLHLMQSRAQSILKARYLLIIPLRGWDYLVIGRLEITMQPPMNIS